jgi:ArsR family transcriptional regulator
MRDLAQLFKALADETRLKMLVLLVESDELCVCDFEALLQISQSASSRHLRRLYQEGLVDHRREGVWVHYRIRDDLSEERQTLLEAMTGLVEESERRALLEALEHWLARKEVEVHCPT